jgi:hypothetical protein
VPPRYRALHTAPGSCGWHGACIVGLLEVAKAGKQLLRCWSCDTLRPKAASAWLSIWLVDYWLPASVSAAAAAAAAAAAVPVEGEKSGEGVLFLKGADNQQVVL